MQITSDEFVEFYFSRYHSIDYLDKMLGLEKYVLHLNNAGITNAEELRDTKNIKVTNVHAMNAKITSERSKNLSIRDVLCHNINSPAFDPGFRVLNINYRPEITSKLCVKCHIRKQYLRLRYCKKCCKINVK
jgi:hypothetical protein